MDAKVTTLKADVKTPPKQPAIVLIPGGPGFSSSTWGDTSFLRKTHDVILVDPPGTGGLRESENYIFHEVVSALEAELQKLKCRMVLVGHSFGGFYATALAMRGFLPHTQLVAVSTELSWHSHQVASQQRSEIPNIDRYLEAFYAHPSEENFGRWLELLAPLLFSDDKREAGMEVLLKDQFSGRSFAELYAQAYGYEQGFSMLSEFSMHISPKFVIGGEKDAYLLPEMLESDASKSNCKCALISDAGHFPQLDNPKEFAETLLTFVNSN